jgi:hypothetical protein
MMKRIPNLIPFPDGPESSPFFGALATALIPALGFTEDMPYFCDPRQSICIECGDCSRTTLQKHRNRLYHDAQTFTGVSLGWVWPEDDSEYQTMPGWFRNWRWPDSFFAIIFGYAGLSWKRLPAGTGKDAVCSAVRASVDAGIPILMKLGFGPDWHVVSGYDENGTLYGLDSHKHFDHTMRPTRDVVAAQGYTDDGLFILNDWFTHFQDAIIITGRADQTVSYREILGRVIQALEHPAHGRLANELTARLDAVTPDNAWKTAQWLLSIVGFPIEARWHAAESNLHHHCKNEKAKAKIFGMIRQYVFDRELDATHGTCWKIWAQLGVGTGTGFALPPDAGELLLKKGTQAELKRLFAIVFDNDRVVLDLLREAAQIIDEDCGK